MTRIFKTALEARQSIAKARYEMAFSDQDTFEIQGDEKPGYRIAMFSPRGCFCGFY